MAAGLSEAGVLKVEVRATSGSIANVNAMASGNVASGFAQSDIAAWHYSGTGIVRPQFKLGKLRLMAGLYPENIHVVTRKSLGLTSVAQLKGLRVAVDEPGSGVLVNARQILRAYGLTERDITPAYIKGDAAAQRMRDGTLDALFFIGGVPSSFVSDLAATTDIAMLPIDGAAADALRMGNGLYTVSSFAASAYNGSAAVSTLAIGAQWVTTSDTPAELVYTLLKRLYSSDVLAQVQASHPAAAKISLQTAVLGTGLPLHAGAERYYREAGVLNGVSNGASNGVSK